MRVLCAAPPEACEEVKGQCYICPSRQPSISLGHELPRRVRDPSSPPCHSAPNTMARGLIPTQALETTGNTGGSNNENRESTFPPWPRGTSNLSFSKPQASTLPVLLLALNLQDGSRDPATPLQPCPYTLTVNYLYCGKVKHPWVMCKYLEHKGHQLLC